MQVRVSYTEMRNEDSYADMGDAMNELSEAFDKLYIQPDEVRMIARILIQCREFALEAHKTGNASGS